MNGKQLRQSLDQYTVLDLAEELGFQGNQVHYQITSKRIPKPTRLHGKRLYYSREDIEKIKRMFGK